MGVGAGHRYALIEFQRDLLGHAAAVGEEQRGAVGVDHVLEGIRQGVPNLEAVFGREPGGFREPNRELDALLHARFDDADGPRGGSPPAVWQHVSADVAGHRFKRTHGGGQGDALHLTGHFHDAFEARHERHAAAVFHHRVDFVQDHGFDGGQGLAAPRGAQDEGQALRRGDEQFGRLAQHALAFAGRRVAAAGLGADAWERLATKLEEPFEFAQGLRQIAADVAVQRLQRRDVEHTGGARCGGAAREGVQRPQKGRERLAAAGGRRDDEVLTGGDAGPTVRLHVCGRAEAAAEPLGD